MNLPTGLTCVSLTNCQLMLARLNYMLLGTNHKLSRPDESTIIQDNTNLERVNNTKFLGVTMDENLNWTNHIEHVETVSKIYPGGGKY